MAGEAAHHARRETESLQTPSERTQTEIDASSIKQITPRPTYICTEPSRESMLPHQMLARRESIDLDDYFVGPRNLDRHSKLPMFMRIHGSVLPRLIIPLFAMACWSTLVTCFSRWVHDCRISLLLYGADLLISSSSGHLFHPPYSPWFRCRPVTFVSQLHRI